MSEGIKKALTVGGAIVAIVLAISFMRHQASEPTETVGNFASIPPKGAGAVEMPAASSETSASSSGIPAKGAGASDKPAPDR